MKKIINSKKDINYLSIINQIMLLLIKLKEYFLYYLFLIIIKFRNHFNQFFYIVHITVKWK